MRIALANIGFPSNPADSIARAQNAIEEAGKHGVRIICFPECYVPGYRAQNKNVSPPDAAFQEQAWSKIQEAAVKANVAVILGTERVEDGAAIPSALVINADGTRAGFQDKVQIDPSEEAIYTPGTGRRVFEVDGVKFGIAICHEGWRYPETVRWPARQGAKIVFHPHFHEAEPGSYRPTTFADPQNTFHEKAMLCRAAENTCYFASANVASEGTPSTSAVINPDGTLHSYQPYGKEGLLIADLDLSTATGFLASRLKPI